MAGSVMWLVLSIFIQDDPPSDPNFNPFPGGAGGVVAPRDPREEANECMKDLDSTDRVMRDGAIARLVEIARDNKDVANMVKNKLNGQKNEWLGKYRNARKDALSSVRKAAGGDLSAKREQALQLLSAGDTKKMRPIVEEMWKATYPDTSSINSDAKVQEVVNRIKECEDSLKKFGENPKEDVNAKLRGIALEQDEELIYAAMPADAVSIMEANKGMKGSISEEEYRLTVLTNMYRVMMGRNALKINPQLCTAARGHSKDMKEKNFFAHDSPVPGKRTPQDRARLAGTSCGAENIYRGGTTAEGAFWAWFESLGHHRNMMAPHRQIGVGHHESFWTECF
jgi:uncharacterized protein YkwD